MMRALLVAAALLFSGAVAQAGCGLFGDSIAVGIRSYFKGCVYEAKSSMPSRTIIGYVQPVDVAIISAGSNDPNNRALLDNLIAIKRKAGGFVIFIAPTDKHAANVIRAAGGDRVVTFEGRPGDQAHPLWPAKLAHDIRAAMPK